MRPLGDLLDDAVGVRLEGSVAVAIHVAAPEREIGGCRHEHEDVLVALRRDRGVDAARLADVERGRVGQGRCRPEDRLEVLAPVGREQERVVLELRQLALHA